MTTTLPTAADDTAQSATLPVLEIQNLTVSYRGGAQAAVRGVNLTIRPGEVVAVIGESGSGKSTLSKAAIGLLPDSARIDSGSIRVAGHELTGLSEREVVKLRGKVVALVPQDPATSLDPVQPIGRQLTEVFRLHPGGKRLSRDELRAKAVELLDVVGIDHPEQRLRQYPHELSGGMKQRILIAIAFGLHPTLLIADEPTSALDVTVQKQVLEVFDRLTGQTGVAVLFVTHNLAVASDHATRAIVMRNGEVLDNGPIDDLVLRPEHGYTRQLISSAFGLGDRGAQVSRAASAPADPVVEVKGLTKVFTRGPNGHFKAVDDVTFTLTRNSTFALVGESGSGKSTTARLILGLTRPDSGQVTIEGTDATGLRRQARRDVWRKIQLVQQNPQVALDPRLTVEQIVDEPLRSFGLGDRTDRRRRVAELLDQVGLAGSFATRKPRELSGGQQQRVAIARALAPRSPIVVLDEALSALDVVTQRRILDLLHEVQRELELTYLFISHDLDLVRSISDHVAVMRRGRIVETGPTERIFAEPGSEYTRALLDAAPGHRLRSQLAQMTS
ncbi:ABC transporter ATP-binding protein [Mycolicibacterium septicum]|uniref:dipeptide ABC transporter ATP-binding protein n=1 Tax=Mycolicibacterium septicum TaxID=98668 RepID=UPI0023E25B0A|nr:ABC transporter ATP-binding protein [Mycolicibacterium septicum]MDF3336403.1 ABC transporter ATP-binding protein [Mycolicibacterium septicum]